MSTESAVSTPSNPQGLHYHLLIAMGGAREEFDRWVAADGATMTQGDWRGLVLNPDSISAVEADARLGRWSQAVGGFAIRITRTSDTRWWLAVHHNGQRLFAMVQHCGDPAALTPMPSIVGNAGRDPLLDVVATPTMDVETVQRDVANQRAEQLREALMESGCAVEADAIAAALLSQRDGWGGIPMLLQLMGASDFVSLLKDRRAGVAPEPQPYDMRKMAKQGLVGCAAPIGAGIVSFMIAVRLLIRMHVHGLVALFLAFGISSLVIRFTRRMMTMWITGRRSEQYLRMEWASAKPPKQGSPLGLGAAKMLNVPLSTALNTWGGLFYLLRDIGFFGGIARPSSRLLNHMEAWAMGPPGLISTMNQVALGKVTPDAMFHAAEQLVAMRNQLIQDHIAGVEPDPAQVTAKVHGILKPIVKG